MKEKTGGRKQGSLNKYSFSFKTKLSESIDEEFIKKIFIDIENIECIKDRVMAKIRVLDYFVPKAKDPEEKDNEDMLRSAIMDKIFPKANN